MTVTPLRCVSGSTASRQVACFRVPGVKATQTLLAHLIAATTAGASHACVLPCVLPVPPCAPQEVAHAEIIRALKVEQAKELTKLRQAFELQARELGVKYEKKMKMLRDDLELRRKQEIHEIEEHKVGVEGGKAACCGWRIASHLAGGATGQQQPPAVLTAGGCLVNSS